MKCRHYLKCKLYQVWNYIKLEFRNKQHCWKYWIELAHILMKTWRFLCTLHTFSKVTVDNEALYKSNLMGGNKRMGGKIGGLSPKSYIFISLLFILKYFSKSLACYASINSSGAHPPRATVGNLITLSVPGVGH